MIIDHEFSLAAFARNYVSNNSDYKLYSFEDSLSVCFNYKDFDPQDLCAKLYETNTLMVGFGNFQNKQICILNRLHLPKNQWALKEMVF